MKRVQEKRERRRRRKLHIRKKISGTAKRPRLCVYRSNKHIYVQAIDDKESTTIASVSNVEADYRELTNSVETGKKLGMVIGERLKKKKIESIVFDRNGHMYHGIVKNIADGAREAGLKF